MMMGEAERERWFVFMCSSSDITILKHGDGCIMNVKKQKARSKAWQRGKPIGKARKGNGEYGRLYEGARGV